jgi:myo-inositol-1(or 4)-monophosphatase
MNGTDQSAVAARLAFAIETAEAAGEAARDHFEAIDMLAVEKKGHQDLVSNADREVEQYIRQAIASAFPDDGIIGEEYPPEAGNSGLTWVIDPIDGTANFVSGIPAWTVVLGCAGPDGMEVGVIRDPSAGETFSAMRGHGAKLGAKQDSRPMVVAETEGLHDGSVGVGFNSRVESRLVVDVIERLTGEGGVFFRNASGALMLAYVAAGRLIGYTEPHMNAWDCVAGMLMIEEAGGRVHPVPLETMLEKGGPVIAAAPGAYDRLLAISAEAFGLDPAA